MSSTGPTGPIGDPDAYIVKRPDFGGLYWPCYDAAPERAHSNIMRHLPDLDKAVKRCTKRRAVIQAGGHVGTWPMRLARHFKEVHTFEPHPILFECLKQNVRTCPGVQRIRAYDYALSGQSGDGALLDNSRAGSARIGEPAPDELVLTIPVKLRRIDDLGIPDVDLIMLDIEGHELHVLHGAQRTIERTRPVIHVEDSTAVAEFLTSLGYALAERVSSDSIWLAPRTRSRRS